ncbi:MAG TPA: hypothetical protein VHZ50_10285 [Puia sp.]|jgi:hypothetical protein|nr:hypothetical protein [Puia sp.]
MNKLFYTALLTASVLIFSCRDTDRKAIQFEDSTANGSGGGGKKGTGGDSSATGSGGGSSKAGSSVNDTAANKMPVVQPVTDNTKIKTPVKQLKKKSASKDSTAINNNDNDNAPAAKKAKIASADNTKVEANTSSITGKAFVSKYGTIPRNTTTDNITDFLVAFTDKTIFIKIYYNADPDADMQSVKAQVVKVLKKSGYNNIGDQSLTLHPIHVPKDIHYELQHDGSVIIWIPPASKE